jgi:uncharacterized protein YndB with AHSA1/START domain
VITSTMSTLIGAERDRIWRALTNPSELIRWDEQLVALLDPAPDFPQLGQRVRWRYRIGSVPVVVHQTIRGVQPGEILQSAISRGVFSFDETYTLAVDAALPDRTRLSLRVATSNFKSGVKTTPERSAARRVRLATAPRDRRRPGRSSRTDRRRCRLAIRRRSRRRWAASKSGRAAN